MWITVHENEYCAWSSATSAYTALFKREGNPVPVHLERGADGNWRVVAEKTAKELEADETYKTLKHTDYWKSSQIPQAYIDLIKAALAKAEGRE